MFGFVREIPGHRGPESLAADPRRAGGPIGPGLVEGDIDQFVADAAFPEFAPDTQRPLAARRARADKALGETRVGE